jgi:hypothetical protein
MLYDEFTYFIFLKIKRYLCVCVEEIDEFDPDRRLCTMAYAKNFVRHEQSGSVHQQKVNYEKP